MKRSSFDRSVSFLSTAVLIGVVVLNPISAAAAPISNTSPENYVTVYGPQRTFAPLIGTTTKSSSFNVSPAPSAGELFVTNGSGDDLSQKSCSGLGLLPKLVCAATNLVNAIRLETERPTSVEISLNGAVVVSPSKLPKTVNSLIVPVNLKASNTLVLKIKGSILSSVTIKIRGLDYTAPILTLLEPTANEVIRSLNFEVEGTSNKALTSVTARLGSGVESALSLTSAGTSFSGEVRALANGIQTLTVSGRDAAGNEAVATRQVNIQYNRQPDARLSLASSATGVGPLIVLFDASASTDPDGDALNYSYDFGDGETVAQATAKISHEFKQVGRFTIELTVRDSAGMSSNASVEVAVTNPQLPPRPEDVATPLSQNSTQTMEQIAGFIYSGSNPIQRGVVLSAIDTELVSPIRGFVQDDSGAPLSGVTVTALGRPELGSTLSREDGSFDFVVNAGGTVALNYSRNGYASASRYVMTSSQNMYSADPVKLVRLDSKVTQLAINAPVAQSAQATTVSDRDGERTATLVVPRETTANVRMPSGATRTLSTLAVRMSEFTVGDAGPEKMPAELPPRTAYTYAVNLSSDEALALGGDTVEFSKPVAFYVDNFLGIRPGFAVPLGYLNKKTGYWEPQKDGVVISIVSVENGIASVDIGQGRAATAEELLPLGIDEDERRKLAELYPAGKSLWRIRTTHFSDFDLNFQNVADNNESDTEDPETDKTEKSCNKPGCEIDVLTRTMKERIALPGTPYDLAYSTAKSGIRNASSTFKLKVIGASYGPNLVRVNSEVSIAGKTISLGDSPIVPNSEIEYTWDGNDAFGRSLNGLTNAHIRVKYFFRSSYELSLFDPNGPTTFGTYNKGTSVEIVPARREYVIIHDYDVPLRPPADLATRLAIDEIGKWTFSNHHFYDVKGKEIYFGNGSSQRISTVPRVVRNIAGNRTAAFSGDGGPATSASLNLPRNAKLDNAGNLLIADILSQRIRKVDRRTGIITTIAGTGTRSFSGDGGPAVNATFRDPTDLFVDRDDNIYITDNANNRIRKINAAGIISTVAGTGVSGYTGDNGPATLAQISSPRGVIVGPDGAIYFSENNNHTVRRIDTTGIITTIAGTGVRGHTGDGGPAVDAQFDFPNYTAFDSRGNLFIAESGTCRIRKITSLGIVSTIAGTGTCGFNGDGGFAIDAQLSDIAAVAVGPDDTIYIADRTNNRIRAIDGSARIMTIVGTGAKGYNGQNFSGRATVLNNPTDVEVRPDGALVIVDRDSNLVREYGEVKPYVSAIVANGIEFASEDGSELYVFDKDSGLHMRTRFGKTGATKYAFEYSPSGLLVSITDANGNVTQVDRASNGRPTEILAPFGQRFGVVLDNGGGLSRLTMPTGESYQMRYNALGLLSEFTLPKGNSTAFEYDSFGYLTRESDAGGGYQTLQYFKGGTRRHQTREGQRTDVYFAEDAHANATIIYDAGMGQFTSRTFWDRYTQTTDGTGDQTASMVGNDPRLRGMASYQIFNNISYPSGLVHHTYRNRSYVFGSSGTIFDFVQTETSGDDLGSSVTTYSSGSRTYSTTTSAGKLLVVATDAQERVTQLRLGNDEPIVTTYLPTGQISTVQQGARQTQYMYDSYGNLTQVTDPLGQVSRVQKDFSGRPLVATNPANESISYGYDLNSNLERIVLPGSVLHELATNVVELFSGYRDPSGLVSSRTYDFDKKLQTVIRKDSRQIRYSYELVGQSGLTRLLRGIGFGSEGIRYEYANGERLYQATSLSRGTITYGYDGSLLTSKLDSLGFAYQLTYGPGALPSRVTFNNSGNVIELPMTYNADRQLISIGNTTIGRAATDGRIESVTTNSITQTIGYSSYGEISSTTTRAGSTDLFGESYVRDALGRITSKTTLLGGASQTYTYSYDLAGRLSRAVRAGASPSTTEYYYDARSNRTSLIRDGLAISATYDAEDRIGTFGDWRYTYTADGELSEKRNSVTNQTTSYVYDELGQLTRVNLPSGSIVRYLIDAERHRHMRTVNNTVTHHFGYDFAGRLVSEFRTGVPGAQATRKFIYVSETHSPDLMIWSGTTYRFVKDHLGSVRLVVNTSTGAIVQSIDYDEFGRVLTDSNPGFQPFGFAGGHYDSETMLVRFGARDYDSEIGRWTAKDPILFDGGDSNLYGYVGSDPVNYIDPSGLRLTTSGSGSQNATLWRAIGRLRQSTRGNELYQRLNNSDKSFNVRFRNASDRKRGGSHAKCNEVVVDPADLENYFETSDGIEQYSLDRILAHEMGHLTGTRDSGPGRMDNINTWENPVMTPIDGHTRISYK